jgi:hypothetical protein
MQYVSWLELRLAEPLVESEWYPGRPLIILPLSEKKTSNCLIRTDLVLVDLSYSPANVGQVFVLKFILLLKRTNTEKLLDHKHPNQTKVLEIKTITSLSGS